MRPFLSHRLLLVFPTLIGATLLVFLLMRVLPGDVAYTLLAGDEGTAQVDPDSLALLRHQLGTDRPLHVQYLNWLSGIPRGDLGTSMWNRLPVAGEIARRLPLTIEIALLSVLLGFGTGLTLGIVSALKRNTLTDSIARFTSVLFLAIPSFWLGMLILMFTVHFYNWMPPMGYFLPWKQPGANITQILFPSLVIGSHIMAIVTRITRSTMLEVLQEDYIRMARAKGFSEHQVVMRHAMKNSMIPVITIVSLSFGSLLGGTIIMERVFSVPGIGSYLIESITVRDYTATQALVLLFGGSFILINLLVDIAYGWLDPRISHP